MANSVRASVRQMIADYPVANKLLAPALAARRGAVRYKSRRHDVVIDSLFNDVLAGSLVVDVSEFRGTFEMDFRSRPLRRLLKFKEYEPALVGLVRRHLDPARDVIDVGANVGLFSVLFAKSVNAGRRVLSIEPTPGALYYLHRNIERNAVTSTVLVYEGVAADEPGKLEINVIPGQEEYSSLGRLVHPTIAGQDFTTIGVPAQTVDSLVHDHDLDPGFIKIDTEGAEQLVLTGTRKTLMRHRPVLLAELSDTLLGAFGTSSSDVLRLLDDTGYRVVDANHPHTPIGKPFIGEVLAIPADGDRRSI